MFIDDKARLRQMLESAKQATSFVEGRNWEVMQDLPLLMQQLEAIIDSEEQDG